MEICGRYIDPLTIVFIVLEFLLFIADLLFVIVRNYPELWEKSWKRFKEKRKNNINTGEKSVSFNYQGSAFELSEIVETGTEQYGDRLPNTLLIIGLLGTFIGIALAIYHIKIVPNNIAASIQNIGEALNGMNTQFFSSIFAIVFVLLRKAFALAGLETTSKRLAWSVEKVTLINKENNKYREQISQVIKLSITDILLPSMSNKLDEMISQLNSMQGTITDAILHTDQNQIAVAGQELVNIITNYRTELAKIITDNNALLASRSTAMDRMLSKMHEAQDKASKALADSLSHSEENVLLWRKSLDEFQANIKESANAVQAVDIATPINALGQQVDTLSNNINTLVQELRDARSKSFFKRMFGG